jgi:ABC-type polysaccharide/polyol phosphate export permease
MVGLLRYDFALQFSLLIVPAFTLVVLKATLVGYAIALPSSKADLVNVLTKLIIFSLFLFSPINFLLSASIPCIATIHRFLPVKYASDAVRGPLVPDHSDGPSLALVVLSVWCLVGW